MVPVQNLVLSIYFMEVLPLLNAAGIIDSKRVESCNNEGDLKGNCKDKENAFCYCHKNKWLCSFDVNMVDQTWTTYKDICVPCEPVCPAEHTPGRFLNLTDLISESDGSSSGADVCNTTMLCQNNGTCLSTNGTSSSYNCSCTDGWEGINCETDINECEKSPCHNNGFCINTEGSYWCICSKGWTGIACDEDIDECTDPSYSDSLCYNNATCSNTNGSYTCNCSTGWEGTKCERDINECQNVTLCKVECINTPGSFRCLCDAGWTGEHCDQDINECMANSTIPCHNEGTCVNTEGSFVCNCTTGWGGATCEYPVDFAKRIEYWNDPENQRRQLETLNSTLLEIKANLTIDKTELTSNRIKRISAPDPRKSAAIAGYLGAGVLSFVFGLLLCLDLTLCFKRSEH